MIRRQRVSGRHAQRFHRVSAPAFCLLLQLPERILCLLPVRSRQDNEFIAASAVAAGAGVKRTPDAFRCSADKLVSCLMSQTVVDIFESIDIDSESRNSRRQRTRRVIVPERLRIGSSAVHSGEDVRIELELLRPQIVILFRETNSV